MPHLSLDQTNQRTKTGRPQLITHPGGLGCSLKTAVHPSPSGWPSRSVASATHADPILSRLEPLPDHPQIQGHTPICWVIKRVWGEKDVPLFLFPLDRLRVERHCAAVTHLKHLPHPPSGRRFTSEPRSSERCLACALGLVCKAVAYHIV